LEKSFRCAIRSELYFELIHLDLKDIKLRSRDDPFRQSAIVEKRDRLSVFSVADLYRWRVVHFIFEVLN
jgi:hypothetical protein